MVDKQTGEKRSRTVLDAYSIGHDLSRGTTVFRKSPPRPAQQTESLRDEMRELVDDVENEEMNPFHFDDHGDGFASGPLVGDAVQEPGAEPVAEAVPLRQKAA